MSTFEQYMASMCQCSLCGTPASVVAIITDEEYRKRTGVRNTKLCNNCYDGWEHRRIKHITQKMDGYYDADCLKEEWQRLGR